MKKMKYIYIVLALILFSACENEIELTSESELTYAGFWDSEVGARAGHTGLYGALRGTTGTAWGLGSLRADIWGGQTFESSASISFIESNFTPETAPYGGWAGYYGNIHKLNDFIVNVANIEFTNNAEKSHMMGQAHGLRAYYYYTLLKTWGAVPLSLVPVVDVDPANLGKPRSSEADIMTQIKVDLKASLDEFGADTSFFKNSNVYWSKAATLALKGDVFIWSGNLLGGGASDFSTAKAALEQVAGTGVSLTANYSDLWGKTNEGNNEFIFAVDYRDGEATNFYGSFTGRTTEIHGQYNNAGDSMDGTIYNGANRYGLTEVALLVSDDTLDSRKNASFIRLYKDDNGGTGYPIYDAAKYYGTVMNKFGGTSDGSSRIGDENIPVYRYADVVLLLAEAKNLLGEDPTMEINQIRARAYGSNYVALTHGYVNGSQTANANAILNERFKEFMGEGKRWWDLRRAGNSFVTDNVAYLSAGDEYKFLLPISPSMLDANTELVQTTGWN